MKFIIFFLMGLTACQPTINWRGTSLAPEALASVTAGKSTKVQVEKLLGPASFTGLMEGEVWFYLDEKTSAEAFFWPTVLKRELITIRFTKEGIVSSIDKQDHLETPEIEMAVRETPTLGRDPGFFKEFFGSVGKYDEGKQRNGMVGRGL